MLSQDKVNKLEKLRRHSTRYELIAQFPDGKVILAGYTKFGKMNILDMLRNHNEFWLQFLSEDDKVVFAKNGRSVQLGSIRVSFSGRTQRQAILEGELPFLGD